MSHEVRHLLKPGMQRIVGSGEGGEGKPDVIGQADWRWHVKSNDCIRHAESFTIPSCEGSGRA